MLDAMFSAGSQFTIAHAKIISETLEGETLIIDLSKGLYFSLNHSGSALWQMITTGLRYDEVLSRMADRYQDATDLQTDIEQFCQRLIEEELVIASLYTGEQVPTLFQHAPPSAYIAPAMEKHNDLESLLLADPVHEFNA